MYNQSNEYGDDVHAQLLRRFPDVFDLQNLAANQTHDTERRVPAGEKRRKRSHLTVTDGFEHDFMKMCLKPMTTANSAESKQEKCNSSENIVEIMNQIECRSEFN